MKARRLVRMTMTTKTTMKMRKLRRRRRRTLPRKESLRQRPHHAGLALA